MYEMIDKTSNMDNGMDTEYRIRGFNSKSEMSVYDDIDDDVMSYRISTGFEMLDLNIGGGLEKGLYTLGAVTGLGKTTFALQLTDNIARAGYDVLFFSLEIDRRYLQAKSISRHMYEISGLHKIDGERISKTASMIEDRSNYRNYSEKAKEVYHQAIVEYSKAAEHITFFDRESCNGQMTLGHVKAAIAQHVREKRTTPVIVIDYLQLLALGDVHANDKQRIEATILGLKRLSDEYRVPMIVVSLLNRDSYKEPVSTSSFKESGMIEYTSDVLLGLQYTGIEKISELKDKNRVYKELMDDIIKHKHDETPVMVELKCLKNRKGVEFTIPFKLQAGFNHFQEIAHNEGDNDAWISDDDHA